MKVKAVHVLDSGTDVFFLVGKMDASDEEWMNWAGWSGSPTLIVKPRSDMTYAVISHFSCPQVDISEKGMSLDSTVLGLVNAVKDLAFEQIPGLVDLRRIHHAPTVKE